MDEMTELFITRGYPSSGKTTWAKDWASQDPDNRARVSRDDIRANILGYNGVGTRPQEAKVTELQRIIIRSLLKSNFSVIVDDTNLPNSRVKEFHRLALENDAAFHVVQFNVSPETCIARDAKRMKQGHRGVGEDVIRGFATRFRLESWIETNEDPLLVSTVNK